MKRFEMLQNRKEEDIRIASVRIFFYESPLIHLFFIFSGYFVYSDREKAIRERLSP